MAKPNKEDELKPTAESPALDRLNRMLAYLNTRAAEMLAILKSKPPK